MDMAFIGEERIAPVADAVEIDAEDVETRNYEGRERNDGRIVVDSEGIRLRTHHSYGTEDKHHSGGERARVAHKNLFLP